MIAKFHQQHQPTKITFVVISIWITKFIYAFPINKKSHYSFPKTILWKSIWKNIYLRYNYLVIVILLHSINIYGFPYGFALKFIW